MLKRLVPCILFTFLFVAPCISQTAADAYSLYSIGNDRFNAGDYDAAISYYKQAAPAYEKVYGANHIYTADVYFFMGVSYSRKGEYSEAISYLKRSLAIYELPQGDDASAANAAHEIGSAYFDSSDYDAALGYFQKALAIRKNAFGENHKDVALSYVNIGLAYEFKGEYKTALSYYQKALSIRQKIFGENHLSTADSYRDVGLENYLLGNYGEAIQYLLKTLEIRESITGSNSIEVAELLGDITTVWLDTGWYADALETSKEAEKIYSALISPDSSTFAVLYNERGRCYWRMGNYAQALLYYNKALEIYRKAYGEKNVYTAKAYLNIGLVYQAMGDYSRAIANLENALEIDKAIFEASHPDIALCYREIGNVYRNKGDFDAALLYFEKSAEMFQAILGERHVEVARCYMLIGSIYENKKDYDNALAYYRKGGDTFYDIFGRETEEIADCYNDIARVYDFIGAHEDAEALYNASLAVCQRLFGNDNAKTALAYAALGWHYAGQQNVDEAIANFKKSYDGLKNGTNYNQIITALNLILRDAETFSYKTNAAFIRDTITLTVETVERARLDMSSVRSDILRKSLPAYYYGVDFEARHGNPIKAFEYSESLRSRGFLDQIGLERALSLDGVKDAEREQVKSLAAQIALARKEIETQSNRPLDERDSEKLTRAEKELADAEKSLAKLDATIGKRVLAYAQLRNPQPVSAKDAQKWCGKNRAVLEYVLWNPALLNDSDMQTSSGDGMKLGCYCIVVTNKEITAVPLDDSYDYAAAVTKLRDGIIPKRRSPQPEVVFEDVRNELFVKLIKPVLPYVKDSKQLLIVPDGSLAFLPFDVLREDEDSKMLCDQYAVSFSPSVSVSMIADSTRTQGLEVFAFGGAWYDTTLSPGEHRRMFDTQDTNRGRKRGLQLVDVELVAENVAQETAIRQDAQENGPSNYFAQKNLRWKDLPGTIAELNALQKVVRTKKYSQRVQEDASERNVKELSHDGTLAKYPILHFACHGYFDKDIADMSSILFSEVSGKLSTESSEDGYLTIPEASTLNLNADMVCLSACETGLGEIKSGDGITGLSRAFMVAGARHVGVTLWGVDDEATAAFMASMYKKIAKRGVTYEQAYQQTKVEFRKSDDFSHPYYWAAFALYE